MGTNHWWPVMHMQPVVKKKRMVTLAGLIETTELNVHIFVH